MTRVRIFCTTLFTNNNLKVVIQMHTFLMDQFGWQEFIIKIPKHTFFKIFIITLTVKSRTLLKRDLIRTKMLSLSISKRVKFFFHIKNQLRNIEKSAQ